MNPKTMSSKQLLATLAAALNEKLESPEDGFKNTREWSKEWGIALSQAQRLVKAGHERGLLEMKRYRIITGQTKRTVPHYRQK